MSFGDDTPKYMPPPPAPVAEPVAAPTFASGLARPVQKGKPYGGTLITNPISPMSATPVARKSLVTS